MSLEKLFKNIEKTSETTLTEEFKDSITEAVAVATSEKDAKIAELEAAQESLVTENEELKSEIDTLKEGTLDEVKAEVEAYKESLVEKISAYLDSEMDKLIPEEAIEAVAKLEVYEPLVEAFKSSISRYGITVDSEGHELLKEAKSEIEKLREAYDVSTRKNVELTTEMEKINSTVTLMEKCDGLTEGQKKKMVVIFKGKSEDEINERFDEVRNMVVESATEERSSKKDVKPVVAEKVEATETKIMEEGMEDLGQRLV
jgi:hypothetical protein